MFTLTKTQRHANDINDWYDAFFSYETKSSNGRDVFKLQWKDHCNRSVNSNTFTSTKRKLHSQHNIDLIEKGLHGNIAKLTPHLEQWLKTSANVNLQVLHCFAGRLSGGLNFEETPSKADYSVPSVIPQRVRKPHETKQRHSNTNKVEPQHDDRKSRHRRIKSHEQH